MKKILLSCIALAAASAVCHGQTFTYDALSASAGTCRISGYTGTVGSTLTIPDTYKSGNTTYKVTAIKNDVFNDLSSLKTVKLGANISKIGQVTSSAEGNGLKNFSNCPKLTKFTVDSKNTNFVSDANGLLFTAKKAALVRVPEGIVPADSTLTIADECTAIYTHAFDNVQGVNLINLPKSLATISETSGATTMENLQRFYISSDNQVFKCREGVLTGKPDSNTNLLYCFPRANDTKKYTTDSGITGICARAFYGAKYLKDLVVNEGVKNFGDRAFAESSIESATLSSTAGDGTTGVRLFENCKSLTEIYHKGKTAKFTAYFAQGCTSLKEVVITRDTAPELGKCAFRGCSALTEFPFESSLKLTGDSVFALSGLQEVYFLTYVGEKLSPVINSQYAFYGNASLERMNFAQTTGVNLPDNFAPSCMKLTELTLPETATFGNATFGYSCQITKITGSEILRAAAAQSTAMNYSGGANTDWQPSFYLIKSTPEQGILRMQLANFFGAANGAVVHPHIYTDSRRVCGTTAGDNGWYNPLCTYYVPYKSHEDFTKISGADVREMFTASYRVRGNPEVYVNSLVEGVVVTGIKVNGHSYLVTDDGHTIGTGISDRDVTELDIVYTVNGVEMSTRYNKSELSTTGIASVESDAEESTAEYFTPSGIRIPNPTAGNLYIVRRGAKVSKEYVK